jgi:hypothetical protein
MNANDRTNLQTSSDRKTEAKKIQVQRSLSASEYVVMAFVMMAVALGLLALFIGLAPRLHSFNISDQVFYILLVVWGLICAVVLFGMMKGYAKIKYKHVSGVVELGGPAAFAALVVVGGFWLVPRSDTFTLTLRPHGPGTPIIKAGKIRVEFGDLPPYISEVNSGEAIFKSIPRRFWGTAVKVLPEIDEYQLNYQSITIDSNAIDLQLTPLVAQAMLRARIVPPPANPGLVKVLIENEDSVVTPDNYGRFKMVIHKKPGEMVRVNVCAGGFRVYDDYLLVGDEEVEIPTRQPDVKCNQ